MSSRRLKIFFIHTGVIVGVLTSDGEDDEEENVNPLDIVPTTASVRFSASSSAKGVQDTLLDLQKLGGSARYEQHISSLGSFVAPSLTMDLALPGVAATLFLVPSRLYLGISIKTADSHKGAGVSWGDSKPGAGMVQGTLRYTNWPLVLSAENDFYIAKSGRSD